MRVVARLRVDVVFFLVVVRRFALRVAAGRRGVVVACGAASAIALSVNAATSATSNDFIVLRIMHILPRKIR
ncbi:MAG TPA: hypothetical protein VFA59_07930 [Vicinamibacterales bacterium]|nr:hypothetical protein [Vicinamibacterales bacterium]